LDFAKMKSRQAIGRLLIAVALAGAGAARAETPPPFDPGKAAAAARIKDPAAATRAYLESVPNDRREKTKAYATGNYVLDVVDALWTVAVMAALLGFGLSARMRDRAERLTRRKPLQTAAYWVQFLVLTTVIGFPLALYRSYFREKAYGLLTQGFGDWMLDQVKALGLGLVIGSLAVAVLYGVLRHAPRTWWIWGAAVMIAFIIVAAALGPVFIEPVFNKFTPVHDEAIRRDILALAKSRGVPADDVLETDISRRSDIITAYVAGALGTTRVVIGDTTLRRCTRPEIRMIMGHEMGHYVLDHVWKGIAVSAVAVVLGSLFVRRAFGAAAARWPRLGVRGVSDVAGLPLLWLLLTVFLAVIAPATNTWSRRLELQADDFGLEASHEPDAAATTFLKLGEYRDLDPNPLVEAIFYDHPSGSVRIRNAMEWKSAN